MAEMARLRTLDEETRCLYDKEWFECKSFVNQLRAGGGRKRGREIELIEPLTSRSLVPAANADLEYLEI